MLKGGLHNLESMLAELMKVEEETGGSIYSTFICLFSEEVLKLI